MKPYYGCLLDSGWHYGRDIGLTADMYNASAAIVMAGYAGRRGVLNVGGDTSEVYPEKTEFDYCRS